MPKPHYDAVLAIAATVDAVACDRFSADTDTNRSLITSAAIRHLAAAEGLDTIWLCGDFYALTVSADGTQAGVMGRTGHFVCGVGDDLVDLGAVHISREAGSPHPAPLILWDRREPMPDGVFGYRISGQVPDATELTDPEFLPFLIACQDLWASADRPAWTGTFIRSRDGIRSLARKGDGWAKAAAFVMSGEALSTKDADALNAAVRTALAKMKSGHSAP